jgi:glycosyltransferase domain-containing protein
MITANKNDLTVLLMLKDRVSFTYRWMDYMNSISFPYKIYVADGGVDETVAKMLSKRDKYPNLDYEYVRYPFDKSYTEYYAKAVDALARIKTPFVAISDNDDFCVTEGLKRSLSFMKSNPDFSACRGCVDGLVVNSHDKKNVLYGKARWIRGLYTGKTNHNDSAAERVQKHLLCYDPTYYDIHRTGQLSKCFKILLEINPQNIYLAELITSCATVAAGKIKREPYLYYVRQCNTGETCNKSEMAKKLDFFDRMLLESWSHDFNGFMKAVAQEITTNDHLPFDEACAIIKNYYKKYVKPAIIYDAYGYKRPNIFGNKILNRARSLTNRLLYDRSLNRILSVLGVSNRYFKEVRDISDYLSCSKGKKVD